MMLTKQKLNKVLRTTESSPSNLKRIVRAYGNTVITEDGRTIEYSEQDIANTCGKLCVPMKRQQGVN